MAKYQSNDWFISIDGTTVSAYVTKVDLDPTIDSVDITAGSGTDFRQRGAGLKDYSISFDIYHDDGAAWALTLITPGSHAVIFGLEGNATGKPKHTQTFIFEGAPFGTEVEKGMVLYSVSGSGAAAPSDDMFAGGVWA